MPAFGPEFEEIERTLAEALGPDPAPEPGDPGRFRDLLRVFLEQQRGGHRRRWIDRLDVLGWTDDPSALAEADPGELADALRDERGAIPPGLVPTLRRIAAWVVERGGMEGLAGLGDETLRDELRALRGVGPQAADRILLEALNRPAFPVSRSDSRILIRHGWIDPDAGYDEAREVVEGATLGDPVRLRRLSAWFGVLAGDCRAAAPRCERCPLRPFLPEGGPREPD